MALIMLSRLKLDRFQFPYFSVGISFTHRSVRHAPAVKLYSAKLGEPNTTPTHVFEKEPKSGLTAILTTLDWTNYGNMLRRVLSHNSFKIQTCPLTSGSTRSALLNSIVKRVPVPVPAPRTFLVSSAIGAKPPPPTDVHSGMITHHDTEYIHYLLKGKIHSIASPQQESRSGENHPIWENPDKYSVYLPEDLAVAQTHHAPTGARDRIALKCLGVVKVFMNLLARYKGPGQMSRDKWLDRVIYLETIAGCHGMIASMARHLRSLRSMTRDYGWISSLLEESENERTHLLILLEMKKPSIFYRVKLGFGQWLFYNAFFISYFLSPTTAHRFVGYFHEETIDSYTKLLSDLKAGGGKLGGWGKEQAPSIGYAYYKLKSKATVYDVIECMRADEANHRDVNHGFASDPILDPESLFLSQK